jgi:hypothetical protein
MTKKSLTNKANDSVNHLAEQNLSTEMVELSDEALSQVCGGRANRRFIRLQRPNTIDSPDDPAQLYNNPMITPETHPELYHPGIF